MFANINVKRKNVYRKVVAKGHLSKNTRYKRRGNKTCKNILLQCEVITYTPVAL